MLNYQRVRGSVENPPRRICRRRELNPLTKMNFCLSGALLVAWKQVGDPKIGDIHHPQEKSGKEMIDTAKRFRRNDGL